MQTFRGNFVFTSYGIGLILMLMLMGMAAYDGWLTHRDPHLWALLLIPASILYMGTGLTLFYFRLSGECLVIKNHLYLGFAKTYNLEDIQSIRFERAGYKIPRALFIKKKNGSHSRHLLAGSLRTRHWKALAQALEDRGIPVDYSPGW